MDEELFKRAEETINKLQQDISEANICTRRRGIVAIILDAIINKI